MAGGGGRGGRWGGSDWKLHLSVRSSNITLTVAIAANLSEEQMVWTEW